LELAPQAILQPLLASLCTEDFELSWVFELKIKKPGEYDALNKAGGDLMQTITPEQARAELDRRQRTREQGSSNTAPEAARAELARRELARRELARRELAKRGVTAEAKTPIPEPKTALENFTYPMRNAYNIQQEEAREGIESMKKAVEEPGIKNTLMGGLGALQYVFSPVTGVAKGIVGEPIEGAAKGLGVPDQGAEFIGRLGENAAYFVTPGGAIKTAVSRSAGPGFAAARKMARMPLPLSMRQRNCPSSSSRSKRQHRRETPPLRF